MKSLFRNIRISQLHLIYQLVNESTITNSEYIKKRYEEFAFDFETSLSFLCDLKLIHIDHNRIGSLSNPSSYGLDNFKNLLRRSLIKAPTEYISVIRSFFRQFIPENEVFYFKYKQSEIMYFSDVRDFLMELDVIERRRTNMLLISSEFLDLFHKILDKNKVSPSELVQQNELNARLGHEAEIEVVRYEVDRLRDSGINKDELQHVSLNDCSAGYDIRSFEHLKYTEGVKIPRYIEVKAVSQTDYKFYWTKNEVNTAKDLKDRYYLYLLPTERDTFNFEKLLIIQNPIEEFDNEDWVQSIELVSYEKKK